MKKLNWEKFSNGVFLVNVLGVIYNSQTRMILIGRRENDPNIKELSWSFPGGSPDYENDLEDNLKSNVKNKTGADVKVNKIIFAKTYPENRQFLSIYYLCEYAGGVEKAAGKFVEIKWIKPSEVKEYFTTSLHPALFEYLKSLE